MRPQVQSTAVAAVIILAACGGNRAGESSTETVRQPTFEEREGLTVAMPAWLRRYPVGCVWLDFSLSKNGRYATAGYGVVYPMRRPCVKYVSNGSWFLKKKRTKWRIIFNGSDPPPCSLGIPRELAAVCFR
jgi:hypothetical protein